MSAPKGAFMINQRLQHNRKLQRLPHYNYSLPGRYFITICTQFMVQWFGSIHDGVMHLNMYGDVAFDAWLNISHHYSNVTIDEFVIMPNHIHGIIGIVGVGTEQCSVPTHQSSLTQRQHNTLSTVVKSFKNVVTTVMRKQLHVNDFSWQRSFYDSIIHNEQSLYRIRKYIRNNPQQWGTGKFN